MTKVRNGEQDVNTERCIYCEDNKKPNTAIRILKDNYRKENQIFYSNVFLEPFCRDTNIYILFYPKICFIQINASQLKMGPKL